MKTKITISLLFTASFMFNSNISQAQSWTPASPNIYFTGGNVGISTSTPAYPLEITGFTIAPQFPSGNALYVGSVLKVGNVRAAIGQVHGTRNVVFGTLDTLSDILFANYDGTNFNHRVSIASAGNVGIGKNTTPDVSALLDVNASNKGVLLPQIALVSTTDATTIASPATSLLVYNLGTGGLSPAGYYYNAGNSTIPNWVMFGVSNGWSLTGNAGTTPGTINFIGTTDNKDFVIKTYNTEKVRVLANGNVGIATSTPQSYAKLDVNTSGNMSVHTMDNANGGLLLGYQGPSIQGRTTSDGNGNLYLNNFGGNVGIGTTTPTQKLVVYGPTASCPAKVGSPDGYLLFGPANTSWCHFYTDRQGFYFDKGISVDGGGISSYYSQDLKLQTSGGVTKVTILDAGGNVGIGTTAPGYKLHVIGNSRFTSDMYLDGQGYYAVGMPWIASDSIFKISIDTLHNALATIKQLKPKSYYLDTANVYGLNFSNKKQYGFIAQEIETILPELITETTKPADYDTTGNVINPALTYKSLNYGAFFGILAKGIQEQSNEIDSLKTKTNNQDSISTALQQAQQQSIDSLRTITVSQDSINVSLQNSLNQLIVKTNYQDSINTSLQNQLNQLLNCCNNNGNNGHGNNLMPSGTHNSEQNNRSIDANDGNLQKTTLTDVKLSNKNIVVLNQNVPNPFAEQTTITYFLPDNVTRAQIIFFEQSGKIIKTIDLTEKGKGQLNVFANDLSSGIYTYSLVVDGQIVETKKMVKAK